MAEIIDTPEGPYCLGHPNLRYLHPANWPIAKLECEHGRYEPHKLSCHHLSPERTFKLAPFRTCEST